MPKTSCVEKQGDFSDCVLTIQQGRRYAEAEKYTFSELQAAVRKRRRIWGLQMFFAAPVLSQDETAFCRFNVPRREVNN